MPVISGSSASTLSGVTVTGTASAGQVPVASSSIAAAWGLPPGYEWSYNQITGNVSITANTEGTANTVVTASAVTFDGAPVVVEFFCSRVDCQGTVADSMVILLQEGATVLGRIGLIQVNAAATLSVPVCLRYRFTPTAAAHTYSITAFQGSGSGTIEAGAGGSGTHLPAYIRTTKV